MKRVTEHANWRQQISRNSSSRLISGHLVVGGLQLSVDSLVLVHPGCKLLLISLNIFGQSDSLGGFERLHVVGDDLVFLSELHDSGLIISETVISALSLNLEGGELLGDLIVFLVGVLSNHLGLIQLLFELLDTLSIEGASALQHFASTIGVLTGLGSL